MINLRIKVSSGSIVYDKKNLKSVLRKAANEVAGGTRALLRTNAGGGRVYRGSGGSSKYRGYKKGHYTASAPGAPPSRVTGTLAGSVKVIMFRSGEGVAIRERAFYALFLAAGAQGGIGSGNRTGSTLSTRKANPNAAINKFGSRRNVYKRGKLVTIAGSRVLAPRPSSAAALAARAASIDTRLKAAVNQDIHWVAAA